MAVNTTKEEAVSSILRHRRNRAGGAAVRAVVALVCLLLVASACSAQGNPPSTSGSDAGSSGKAIDVCSLVTKADVAAAYGGDVGAGKPDGTTCHFEVGGAAKAGKLKLGFNVPEVIVSLTPGEWGSAADQQKLFPKDKVTPVSGLGEEAWYSAGTLNVKHGTDRLTVYNSTDFVGYDVDELAADTIALAKLVYPRL